MSAAVRAGGGAPADPAFGLVYAPHLASVQGARPGLLDPATPAPEAQLSAAAEAEARRALELLAMPAARRRQLHAPPPQHGAPPPAHAPPPPRQAHAPPPQQQARAPPPARAYAPPPTQQQQPQPPPPPRQPQQQQSHYQQQQPAYPPSAPSAPPGSLPTGGSGLTTSDDDGELLAGAAAAEARRAPTQAPPAARAAAAGPRCAHGAAYAACAHRAAHAAEVQAELAAAGERFAFAEGAELAALQARCRELADVKRALAAAPPAAAAATAPAAAAYQPPPPQQQWQAPQQLQQQQWTAAPREYGGGDGDGGGGYAAASQQQWGGPPPRQQQWGGGGGGQPHAGAYGGSGGGGGAYNGGGGGAYNGGAPAYAAALQQAGGYGGGGNYAGGGYGGAPQQQQGAYIANQNYHQNANASSSGGYAAAPLPAFSERDAAAGAPPAPWEPDRALLAAAAGRCLDANGLAEWRRTDFPWSADAARANAEFFGNPSFRMAQLAVVNATMAGRDAFCLMPTGGGKSLCYQLPAVLSAGLTVVVSPLVSLIQDQLHLLAQMGGAGGAGIPAAALGSSADAEGAAAQRDVFARARSGELKVLFITPEKVEASAGVRGLLADLHGRGALARVVIDEAHCVSAWGHDFRPAYTKLCYFKQQFPSLPLLALTATATPRVQLDIACQLGLASCLMFTSSFNRPNLEYAVLKKERGKALVEQLAGVIAGRPGGGPGARGFIDRVTREVQSGIVYCFSRRDCEATADALEAALAARLGRPRGAARRVRHYHAELDPAERERVQSEWTAGEVPVVCATVAFGMGINKPDVRFVVHHSMPKSLEGFLQESGRAGRDGAPASCFLLYGRGDGIKQREMIERSYAESRAPEAQKRAQRAVNDDALRAMQAFCEEPCECRRVALLAHFGEAFSAATCRATCDNCRATAGAAVVRRDVSAAARAAVAGVRQVGASRPLAHVADVLRGANNKRVRDAGHAGAPCFGALRAYGATTADVERLLRRLVSEGVLLERTRRLPPAGGQQYGQVVAWLEVEERAAARLEAGALRVELTERAAAGAAGGAGARRAPAAVADATQLATQAAAGAAAAARPRGGARASRPALPLSRPAPPAAAGAPPPGRARADVVDLVSDDGSDGEGGGAGAGGAAAAAAREREYVMRLMMRQLNAAAKARFGQKRAPFNGSVQAAIAAAAPASAAGVDALAVPGLSALIKRRYGSAIAAGVAQADVHLAAARARGAAAPRIEDFRLDADAALAEVEGVAEAAAAAGAKRARAGGAGTDGWADSDGDWADTPPAAKAAAAGAPLSADAVLDGLFVGGRAAGAGSGGARKGGGGAAAAGIAAWRPGPAQAPPPQQQVRTAAVEDVGGAFGDYGDADDGW